MTEINHPTVFYPIKIDLEKQKREAAMLNLNRRLRGEPIKGPNTSGKPEGTSTW